MREIQNWDDIQAIEDGQGYDSPAPGGYIVKITEVEDREEQEGLLISYDIARGDYTGYAADTELRAGFWPLRTWVSYKDSALRFFKGFITCVEVSNPNYHFSTKNVQGLVGKYFGVVLGEEQYRKKNGDVGIRLYTAQRRSGQAIKNGDFKIPDLKPLKENQGGGSVTAASGMAGGGFMDLADDDGKLPF